MSTINRFFNSFLNEICSSNSSVILLSQKGNEKIYHTYQELFADVNNIFANLQSLDLVHKRVIFYAATSYEWIACNFAFVLSESISILIPSDINKNEFDDYCVRFEPDYIVTDKLLDNDDMCLILSSPVNVCTNLRIYRCLKYTSYKSVDIPKDVSLIFLSSGSTGATKGVMHSLENVLLSSKNIANELPRIENTLLFLPVTHIYGYCCVLLPALIQGAQIEISQGTKFIFKELVSSSPTALFATPAVISSLYNRIINVKEQDKSVVVGSKLKTILSGGAPLPSDYIYRFKKLGIFIINGYGSSELCGCISLTSPCDSDENCVGHIFKYVEVKIVDDILWINSPCIMSGYFGDIHISTDDWFCTNDRGAFINDKLYIYGRSNKNLVLNNGEKLDPEPLKKELMRNPYIYEANFGVVDNKLSVSVIADLNDPESKKSIRNAIITLNRNLPPSHRISKVSLKNMVK